MGQIKLYPSLIDSYHYFMGSEAMSLREMLDRINRVPSPKHPAALKGTAYNELIDALVKGESPERGEMKKRGGLIEPIYIWDLKFEDEHQEKQTMRFEFPQKLSDNIAKSLAGSAMQVFTKAEIDTSYGRVLLYGYVDYVRMDTAIDLKTYGSAYTFPKYAGGMQHPTYLYCLREEGNDISRFIYLTTNLSEVMLEDYYWEQRLHDDLLGNIEGFLQFVDRHSHLITDRKILGLE